MPLDVLNITPLPMQTTSPVVLMVSGGSDSTALLVRAATDTLDLKDGAGQCNIDKGRLVVLHINHHIRGAAADADEQFVRDTCAQLGIECVVRHFDIPALIEAQRAGKGDADSANLEDVARQARYQAAWDLVRQRCAQAHVDVRTARVLVAHTADDRAETFVMRAITGAGLSGLTGMRWQRGIVVRPLLDQTRSSLRAYLTERRYGWCEDATNDEDDALRSYIRHHVTPAIRERVPSYAQTLGRCVDVLADDADLLDRLANALLDRALRPSRPQDDAYLAGEVPSPGESRRVVLDADVLANAELSLARRAVQSAVLLALGEQDGRRARLEYRHIAWVLDIAHGTRQQATLPLDTHVERQGDTIVVLPASAAAREEQKRLEVAQDLQAQKELIEDSAPVVILPVPGCVRWGDAIIEADLIAVPAASDPHKVALQAIAQARATAAMGDGSGDGSREGRNVVILDAARAGVAKGGELAIRGALPGERMQPFGLHGHSKLIRDLLADAHVPVSRRSNIAVVHTMTRDSLGHVSCGNVMWVAGIRADERGAYTPSTTVLLRCKLMGFRAKES